MLGETGQPITRGRVVPPIETIDMLLVLNRAAALGYDWTEFAFVIALHLASLSFWLLVDWRRSEAENLVTHL